MKTLIILTVAVLLIGCASMAPAPEVSVYDTMDAIQGILSAPW